jgi:aldehyde dehydrogenase (NAD+)
MESNLRKIFDSGITRKVEHRIHSLRRLKDAVLSFEPQIIEALRKDLGKSEWESRATETGFVVQEINHTLNHIEDWTRIVEGPVPIASQPASTRIIPSPKGTVLVIAPWNYPFQLALTPVISALAAGNVCAVKPSELTPHVGEVLQKLIASTFPHGEVACQLGGPDLSTELLAQPFAHFFFTGSTRVGRIVARAAAEHLASTTLELGGKSPCIIEATANIKQAARKIAWGKSLNAGQTCVAPDYLVAHQDIHDELIKAIMSEFKAFYGSDASKSPDYGRIVNTQHFERLVGMLNSTAGTVLGGRHDSSMRYIEPTIISNVDVHDSTMTEEIFGPILPVLKWKTQDDLDSILRQHPDPLAFYVFTSKQSFSEKLIEHNAFGGGCVNHVIHHLACPELPFGGIRASGIGNYHGKYGFDTFTHYKAILDASPRFDLSLKYPPYKSRAGLLKWLYR